MPPKDRDAGAPPRGRDAGVPPKDRDAGAPLKGRDTARTRRAVLDAAARTVARQGAGVSLDVIAREAGVSKSGLLHHFRSRDELLRALTQDQVDRFVADVRAAVDPADHAPGRLVRAYVKVIFEDLDDEAVVSEHLLLAAALSTVPGVAGILQEDARQWESAFTADGLHPDRVLLITKAADGASLATLYEGGSNPAALERTRDLLLSLSRGEGPFT
ncbi:TetR family transcriptional regulator [Paractinoplanes deccanensis]|uniref:TetR family transcriptional regulator n=1 Tax=Paractinoplanes deccanensis TaxID=113561 RepID=A0ABQ3YB54_9ACTN|nr:TetR family transcriptional regulator [Actinoplanes deccanensis]